MSHVSGHGHMGFMVGLYSWSCCSHLICLTRSLTVLSQCAQSLVNQADVSLIDVETEETQSTCRTAAYAVKEAQRLAHQVVA